jgi:hypothetical protein
MSIGFVRRTFYLRQLASNQVSSRFFELRFIKAAAPPQTGAANPL